ncbi:MAG TPA: hemerythrin domain-containing protein [Thermoanaerobaculia bacterium]|nr:hemerythrin domain-containing protein [Thermoanaerobaculia bacterium]
MLSSVGRGKDIPGLPEVDLDHQLQLALVDAFGKAAGANERIEAGRILEQMADLSEMHFLAEELVMRLHGYPAFKEHAAEHANLMREMNELLRENAAGTLDITLELAGRLRRTLANHLGGTDHALTDYMLREGIRASVPKAPPD